MSQVSDYTSYKNATQRMQDSYESERADSRANHEKEIQQVKEEAQEDIQAAKKEYNERVASERAQARDEVNRLKDELYDRSGKNTARDAKLEYDTRNQLQRFQEEIKKDADQKIARVESRKNEQSLNQKNAEEDHINAAMDAQKKSTYRQVAGLEDELQQYREADRDVSHDRAEAKQQTISETEKQYMDDRKRIIDGYEHQITKMKDHEDEMGHHYDRQLTEATFNANQRSQNQVRNQKAEFTKLMQDENKQRGYLEKNFQNEVNSLKARDARSTDHLIRQNFDAQTRVAENKDQTYQNYIGKKDAQYDLELSARDAKIQDLRTTDDPLKVSPFVVKKITDSSDARNYKQLTEAQNVYDKNLDATKNRDQEDRKALQDQYRNELTGFSRASRKESDLQSRQFQSAYTDMQSQHQAQVTDLKEQKRNQVENLSQKQAIALAAAETQKQEALGDQRDSLVYQKAAALDDADQLRRTQDREWFMKTNDLRRNFEAKLSEERDQHEKLTSELKMEYDKKLRDQDRTSKRAIDDRVRAYEHQITQQNLAFREKERFLTEHYEEELDRMKRTNAQLIQKKS